MPRVSGAGPSTGAGGPVRNPDGQSHANQTSGTAMEADRPESSDRITRTAEMGSWRRPDSPYPHSPYVNPNRAQSNLSVRSRRSDGSIRSEGSIRREEAQKERAAELDQQQAAIRQQQEDVRQQQEDVQQRLAEIQQRESAVARREAAVAPQAAAPAAYTPPAPTYRPPAPSSSYSYTPAHTTPAPSSSYAPASSEPESGIGRKYTVSEARAASPGFKAVFPRYRSLDGPYPRSFEKPDASYEIWKRWRDLKPENGNCVDADDGKRFERTAAAPTELGETEEMEQFQEQRKHSERQNKAEEHMHSNFRGYNEHGGSINY